MKMPKKVVPPDVWVVLSADGTVLAAFESARLAAGWDDILQSDRMVRYTPKGKR